MSNIFLSTFYFMQSPSAPPHPPHMHKNFPIWDNLVFHEQIHNIRTIIGKFQTFDETWLKIGCLVKVVACSFHKSSTYIAAIRVTNIYLCDEQYTHSAHTCCIWVMILNLFIFKVSKLPEFQFCCWLKYMGVENICPLWGEERREEKREIHVDEDWARRSSPSPTQKVVTCTSCYSHS